jgi:hypothetical protein
VVYEYLPGTPVLPIDCQASKFALQLKTMSMLVCSVISFYTASMMDSTAPAQTERSFNLASKYMEETSRRFQDFVPL